jgi:uncharacterized membrane protein
MNCVATYRMICGTIDQFTNRNQSDRLLAEWSGWTLFSMPVVVMAVYWLIIIDGEAK